MMKVLWFTPTPSMAEDYLNNHPMNGGFVKSLEKELQNKVDLNLVFYHKENKKSFSINGTTYFPINRNRGNIFTKIKNKIFTNIEHKEDVLIFLDIIKQVNPDIIHIHGTESPFGLIQKHISLPVVISIQGNITTYKFKFFSGIPLWDVFKYSKLSSRLLFKSFLSHYRRFQKLSIREKEILGLSKYVLGRTHWDRRISLILAPYSTYFQNDDILKQIFYESNWNNSLGKSIKLFTTNGPNLYKGIETLIYCAYLLDQNKIEYSWQVAGLNIHDEIVHIAKKSLGILISKNIEFLGRIKDNKLKDLLLESNIYISISHIENSPNSLCEALLLGMPCIATNAGGTLSLIKDNKNGVLIQDGDPYVMAGAILELKANYDNAIKMGNEARKQSLVKHNKKKIVNEVLSIYNEVIKETMIRDTKN